jgi:hypothetical protein
VHLHDGSLALRCLMPSAVALEPEFLERQRGPLKERVDNAKQLQMVLSRGLSEFDQKLREARLGEALAVTDRRHAEALKALEYAQDVVHGLGEQIKRNTTLADAEMDVARGRPGIRRTILELADEHASIEQSLRDLKED